MKIGFILNSEDKNIIKKNKKILVKEKVDNIIFGDAATVDSLLNVLNEEDTLVISNLYQLQKTIVQLKKFVTKLLDKKILLRVVNKMDTKEFFDDRDYMSLLITLGKNDQELMSYRTKKGIRDISRIGRPRIDINTINKIKSMTNTNKYTVNEVAKICGVSVGSVYKYRTI